MNGSGMVVTTTEGWRAEIARYLRTFKSSAEMLEAHADGRRAQYHVLVVAPEANLPEAVWGPAIAEVLQQNGMPVVLDNVGSLTRDEFDAHLRDADSIVMLVMTNGVAIECINAISEFKQKLIVCFPMEDMESQTYSVLSQRRYNLDILPFSRAKLGNEKNLRIGPEVFTRLCDKMTVKSAEEARRLRIQETMVVLVHGILSMGVWHSNIKRELKANGLLAESTNAGLVQLPAFILPLDWLRNKPVDKVWRDIQTIKNANSKCRISILAHSFGTFIVSRLFEREDQFGVERIAFCGSIAPEGYAFPVGTARCGTIINEVGCSDFWPALAHSITWGYGKSGTYGFQSPGIEDRWHDSLGHGGFLTRDFCRRFWIPYFEDGSVVPGDGAQLPPLWIKLLTLFPLRWFLLLIVLTYPVWWTFNVFAAFFR